jgi:para-aminobenzoate synthetase/4-amino-4-deoxychorismate lyase
MTKSPEAVLRAAAGDDAPFALVGAWGGRRALVGSDPLLVVEDSEDPFALVDEQPEITCDVPGATGGGWVGYLGYGLGGLIEKLPSQRFRPVALPGSVLGFYDHLLACDRSGQWWFEALWSSGQSERLERRLELWRRRAAEPDPEPGWFECGPFGARPGSDSHLVAVSRAIEHIRSGDVFQANICTRLEARFCGDPVELFCRGARHLAPRYGAFLGHGSVAVASFSPELYLKRQGRSVLSSPIKGTACRLGPGLTEREQLLSSAKDRAENLMIVDLVRNDLGRVCRDGSVKVAELCRAEEHPGLWHLVSDVTGELREGVSDAELLRASFPPGSVTGAPKVRAMQLVAVLEGTAREVYTGAIGIASPLTGLELNVAIRTFELAQETVWLGVGGGIVADSDPARELDECFDKAGPLLEAVGADLSRAMAAGPATTPQVDADLGVFETILVLDGRPVELESHLGRLAASVTRLYGTQLSARLGAQVVDAASDRPGAWRLRILVRPTSKDGLSCELSFLAAPEAFAGGQVGAVRLVPALLRGGLGRHKWHDRRVLARMRRDLALSAEEQLILVDDDGTVLETEQANVFAVLDGVLRTAPDDGRIRAGTTREAVIALSAIDGIEVSTEMLRIDDLTAAEEMFVTSSIRGVSAVNELRGQRSFETGRFTVSLSRALWRSWGSSASSMHRSWSQVHGR